ncbi:MAG: biopolymer transporter ExbD [Ignavibacteriales bacterium]|nr:MAG: biopolymer transporter ExbD [Ignavibacteriales bacterium]
MKFESPQKLISAFNFSSLTDIVMLLLIFFLLSSQFVLQTGVKVKLPGAKNNEQAQATNFSVTITDQGRIYVGSDEVGLNALAGKLSIIKKNQSDNLTIRADKSVKIDIIIKVIDAAKGIGIDKFTIQTEKISF